MEDIYQLCRDLSQKHDLPLELSYSDAGGHVFILKKTSLDGELPKGFVNVTSRGGKWHFSSLELVRQWFAFQSLSLERYYWTVEEEKREDEGRIRRSIDTQREVGGMAVKS